MAGPFDLTGQNIENTYQRILQTPDGVNVYDGTGSAFVFTATVNTSSLVTTSSFNAFTASINNFTSSYNTGSFSGSFTGSLNGTASWAQNALQASTASYYQETDPIFTTKSASLATTGSNNFNGDQTVTGSLIITNNLTVLGSQSIQYITSSQLDISTNIITVNTSTPAVRFGGLAVKDSGSLATGLTGSLLWDSQNNVWIYSNPSGAAYDGGLLLTGPRNTSGLGNEVGITTNVLAKGDGSHHMTSSQIVDDGTTVTIPGSLSVGTTNITGSLIVNYGTYDIINVPNYQLNDSNGGASINWDSKLLQNGNRAPLDWNNGLLQSSNADEPSIDWENRILYASDGTTPSLNWSSSLITTSPTFFTTTISTGSQEDFSSTSNYAGTVIEGQIIESPGVNLYDLVCLRGGGWDQNVQSGVNRSTLKLGIYLGNNLVLTEGHIVLDQDGVVGPSIQAVDIGVPIFIREGVGTNMSCIPPSSGYVRILGHIYYQNQNNNKLFIMRFNPSNDFYLLG